MTRTDIIGVVSLVSGDLAIPRRISEMAPSSIDPSSSRCRPSWKLFIGGPRVSQTWDNIIILHWFLVNFIRTFNTFIHSFRRHRSTNCLRFRGNRLQYGLLMLHVLSPARSLCHHRQGVRRRRSWRRHGSFRRHEAHHKR